MQMKCYTVRQIKLLLLQLALKNFYIGAELINNTVLVSIIFTFILLQNIE